MAFQESFDTAFYVSNSISGLVVEDILARCNHCLSSHQVDEETYWTLGTHDGSKTRHDSYHYFQVRP